jgi:hypothetical protein
MALAAPAASCGSESISTSLGAGLNGTWQEVVSFPGISTTLHLAVSDTVVTGTGAYTIEAGRPGTIIVSGAISGSVVNLDLARSDSTTQHFRGTFTAPDLLTGISWFQDPVSDSYRRSGP